MKKSFLTALSVAAIVLTACAPALPPVRPTKPVTVVPTKIPPTKAPPTAEAYAATAVTTKVPATAEAYASPTVIAPAGPQVDPASLFPPVSPDELVFGNAEAKVTIIEYSDYQCPYCAQLFPVLEKLYAKYPNDVRIVYRHFPLTAIHEKAFLAAEAAEAAHAQGQWRAWHVFIFEHYTEWYQLSIPDFRTLLDDYAAQVGLDVKQFSSDLDTHKHQATIDAALQFASTVGGQGLPGTPFVLFNGEPMQSQLEFWVFDALTQLELIKARQFSAPQVVIDPFKKYTATLKTEKGDVVIRLFPEQAPQTVNSFVFLAQNGWFDNITFHRVIPGFVAQTGDPTGTGIAGPGYLVPNEIVPELTYDAAGVVGMANSGADTNGSQFFITYGPTPNLDGKYTIFGKVISGLDVLEKITPRNPQQGQDLPAGDRLITVLIEEK